jgi:hypothetical protein
VAARRERLSETHRWFGARRLPLGDSPRLAKYALANCNASSDETLLAVSATRFVGDEVPSEL